MLYIGYTKKKGFRRMEKEQLTQLIGDYIEKHHEKEFIPNQSVVQYAGLVLDRKEYEAIVETLLHGWFGLSEIGTLFEKKVSERLGKNYGVYTNSGSSANLLALETMKELYCQDMTRNKIIIPAASFPTTLNPVLQLGFEPVFVDVDLETYEMNDAQMQDALKDENVIGIMFAHPLGNPVSKTKEYYFKIKERNGFLIEDCCDALDSRYNNGELVGKYSDAATCSFYAAHHMSTGEGGLVALNDKKSEIATRSFRDWGRGCFCKGVDVLSEVGACQNRFSDWLKNGEITDHRYVYERVGYNMKPLELQAAMGLEQLKKLDHFTEKRKDNFKLLSDFMKKYENYFYLPRASEGSDPSWFSFPLTVKENAPFKRYDIVRFLESKKIQTRNFFAGNLLDHPAYKKLNLETDYSLKNASLITTNTFMIGVYPGITEEMYQYVFSVFEDFFKNFDLSSEA